MTNDRAIVMLKGAHLAALVAGAAFVLFTLPSPPSFSMDRLPPMWLYFVALALIGASDWQMKSALKKRMGGDSFSLWREITGRGFCLVILIGFVAMGWDGFVSQWQGVVLAVAIVITTFWVVPAVLKKRMAADAFAKFNRKYQRAASAVMIALVLYPSLSLWISK